LFIFVSVTVAVSSSPLNQVQIDTLANTMSIKAKNLYNLRDNEKTHTVRLYVKNTGSEDIPPTGWRLYFHSMYLMYPDVFPKNMTVELEVEHITVGMVQGDLYYLEPSSGFVGIHPGEERVYDIVAKFWMISRTDFMPLWYVVSANGGIKPRVVKTIESLDLEYVEPYNDVRQWKRFAADRYNPFTAQKRLERYKTTDTRKVYAYFFSLSRIILILCQNKS
jgi:hexosaminidase